MITDLHLNVEYFNVFSTKSSSFKKCSCYSYSGYIRNFAKVTRITKLVIR